MIDYATLFFNNILPIFLGAGTGYLLAKWRPIDPKTVSSITFYIFSPCLVFTLLTTSKLSTQDISLSILIAILNILIVGLLTWFIGVRLRLERSLLAAVLITSMFMNAGNFGLPVTLFAFGDEALAFASLFFVSNVLLTNTAGVVIASMGSEGFRTAMMNLIKLPALYAIFGALIILQTGWKLPVPVERATELLGDASIPALMVLLGIQFHNLKLGGQVKPLLLAGSMRLLVSPVIAILLGFLFGLQGPARQALVLESAMPAAIMNTVLATQYNTQPSFVTAVVVITTLVSGITLPVVMIYLGA